MFLMLVSKILLLKPEHPVKTLIYSSNVIIFCDGRAYNVFENAIDLRLHLRKCNHSHSFTLVLIMHPPVRYSSMAPSS